MVSYSDLIKENWLLG